MLDGDLERLQHAVCQELANSRAVLVNGRETIREQRLLHEAKLVTELINEPAIDDDQAMMR